MRGPAPARDPAAALERDGFACLGAVLHGGALTQARLQADAAMGAAAARAGLPLARWRALITMLPDPERWAAGLGALRVHPPLVAAASGALGGRTARCALAHLVLKPPGSGRPLPWHIDRPTWDLPPGAEAVAIWVALDPATSASGTLRYAPGTHRAPTRDVDPVVVEVPAGHAVMHHAAVLHASAPNRTPRWRVAWIGVFVAA